MQSGTINASDIGDGIGVSWTTISKYNNSKQFQNYNNGSLTNRGMQFIKGDVVFINLNADTFWENQTWDTDTNYNNAGFFNLTNTSNNWNVVGIQNQTGRTIGNFERLLTLSNVFTNVTKTPYGIGDDNQTFPAPINDTFEFISYFNNTAGVTKKFTTHPFNRAFNNLTDVDFGEVLWTNINQTWNFSNVIGEIGYITIDRRIVVT